MRPNLTHIALHVRDLEACISFYSTFCGMRVVHARGGSNGSGGVVWLAEPGREHELILVLLAGGRRQHQAPGDFSHLGFALASREEVDAVAEQARSAGVLIWEPCQDSYPVGYYCGVRDPDGNFVEFSYGQPLGPGAPLG